MKAIVYTSNTGHTRQYAELLGERLGLPVYPLEAAKCALAKGAEIVYLGCCTIPVDRARRPEAEHRPFPLHRIKRRRGAL